MELLQRRGDHVTQGVSNSPIHFSQGEAMAIAAFTAVAWYNIIELNVQVFMTFKRHRGLYFWSLLISGYGCILHALGFLLKFFALLKTESLSYLVVTIISIGWWCMVTGQAVVLYSRLHLVVREQRVLRGILTMIIVDAILFHIPTTVLTYETNSTKSNKPDSWTAAFNVVEKLQMTAFCIQEFIISGVYVWSTIRLLRPVYHGRTRKVMMQLIWINLIIIAMDVCLLALEYSNSYVIEAELKPMVYSIKLKLEFSVLNQLMTLANSSVNAHQSLPMEDAEKATKGRSKSTEYISSKYEKPGRWDKKPPKRTESPPEVAKVTNRKPSQAGRQSSFGAYGSPSKSNFPFMASLDRNIVVETKHIENAKRRRTLSEPELNEINNPAAHFRNTARRTPQHDKYGDVFEEEDDDDAETDSSESNNNTPTTYEPIVSPTLTGTTIQPYSPPENDADRDPSRGPAPPPNDAKPSRLSLATPSSSARSTPSPAPPAAVAAPPTTQTHISQAARRRAPAPPSLTLRPNNHLAQQVLLRQNNGSSSRSSSRPNSRPNSRPTSTKPPPIQAPLMPNGLVRSTRPSVSEWGRGADSEPSPASDEMRLNPYDTTPVSRSVPPTSSATASSSASAAPNSGSVRAARERASRNQGMDFVTSALSQSK